METQENRNGSARKSRNKKAGKYRHPGTQFNINQKPRNQGTQEIDHQVTQEIKHQEAQISGTVKCYYIFIHSFVMKTNLKSDITLFTGM